MSVPCCPPHPPAISRIAACQRAPLAWPCRLQCAGRQSRSAAPARQEASHAPSQLPLPSFPPPLLHSAVEAYRHTQQKIPSYAALLQGCTIASSAIGSSMVGSEEVSGLTASLGELHVEASSSKDSEVSQLGNAVDHVAIADDEIWDDGSDFPGHGSTLDREWVHRKNQFHKMGYRDGIAEGQKDITQEGFNVGFGQSVHVGYKWGLVRGITSALASLPDSLKEKLLPSVHCSGQLQDLNNSVQEISAEDALQMFHESILRSSYSSEEPRVTLNRATDSSRLQNLSKDLVLLLHECPDMKASEELTRDS